MTRDSDFATALRTRADFLAKADEQDWRDEVEPSVALLREAASRLEAIGKPVYRVDWENAPRDGSWVLLLSKGAHPDYRIEQRLFWSKHYSIHGLGGCWSDGFVTMSDRDFIGWRFEASPTPSDHVAVPVDTILMPREPLEELSRLNDVIMSLARSGADASVMEEELGEATAIVIKAYRRAALPRNQGETKP